METLFYDNQKISWLSYDQLSCTIFQQCLGHITYNDINVCIVSQVVTPSTISQSFWALACMRLLLGHCKPIWALPYPAVIKFSN